MDERAWRGVVSDLSTRLNEIEAQLEAALAAKSVLAQLHQLTCQVALRAGVVDLPVLTDGMTLGEVPSVIERLKLWLAAHPADAK